MRLELREAPPIWLAGLAPVLAVAAALILCAGLIVWAGESVFEAYALLIKGAVGSRFALTETLSRATPLILTGLAAAVAFRAKLWNIGGEGQLYMGALAATWLGTGALDLPAFIMIPFLLIAGALAGGAVLIVPALSSYQYHCTSVHMLI